MAVFYLSLTSINSNEISVNETKQKLRLFWGWMLDQHCRLPMMSLEQSVLWFCDGKLTVFFLSPSTIDNNIIYTFKRAHFCAIQIETGNLMLFAHLFSHILFNGFSNICLADLSFVKCWRLKGATSMKSIIYSVFTVSNIYFHFHFDSEFVSVLTFEAVGVGNKHFSPRG